MWGMFAVRDAFFASEHIPQYAVLNVHDEAERLHDGALQWLLGMQKENGLFHYQLNPRSGAYSPENNELRQLMASRVLARAASRDAAYHDAHRRNLHFVFSNWYQEEAGRGYIVYEGKSKLGSNAMLLRALVESPFFDEYALQASKTAEGLLYLMREDGSFKAWLKEPGYAYDEDYLLTFYSGEALLALMEYADKTNDERIITHVQHSADFYVQRYVTEMDVHYYPAYVPWMTMALERLCISTGEQKYSDAIFAMNDKLLEMQDTTRYVGRFYNPNTPEYGTPHSSSDAVYTEGMIHAWNVARTVGDTERERTYFTAITKALGNLATLQYRESVPGYAAPQAMYLGAIRINADTRSVRIDCAQHLIDALEYLLAVGV